MNENEKITIFYFKYNDLLFLNLNVSNDQSKVFLMINVFQLRNQLRNQFRSQIETHRGLRSSFDFNGFGYTKSTFKTFFDFIVSFIAPLVARC